MTEDSQVTVGLNFGLGYIEGSPTSIQRLLRGDLSIFLFGAKGTGKTSFVQSLSGGSVETIRGLRSTTNVEPGSTKYFHRQDGHTLELPIVYKDSPGDPTKRTSVFSKVRKSPPLVILFFIDHLDTDMQQRDALKNPKEREVRRWEFQNRERLGEIDPNRIKEHKTAWSELAEAMVTYSEIKQECRLIIPVVTKYDMWQEFHDIDEFYDLFKNEFAEFQHKFEIKVNGVMPCSSTINIDNELHKIVKRMATETQKDRKLFRRIKRSIGL